MAIFPVRFLWRARTQGGFPYLVWAHGQWRSRPSQPVQAARLNIRAYRACAVCRPVLVRIMVGTVARCGTFHEGLWT